MRHTYPPVENSSENLSHTIVLHLDETQVIKVPRETHRDRIAAATRWSHGAAEVDIDEIAELANSLAVVPTLEVHPLTNELDGRLCTVDFERRHVQVVDEEDKHLAKRRTINSLSSEIKSNKYVNLLFIKEYIKIGLDRPLVEFGIDQVLGLIGARLGREDDKLGRVLFGHGPG